MAKKSVSKAPKSTRPSKKSAAPKAPKAAKKASKKAAAPKAAKAPKADSTRGAGRPEGATNYVPTKALEVRDSGKFKGLYETPVGPRWIRVYAATPASSLQLAALRDLLTSDDASLLRLLNKRVKELS